MIGWKEVRIPRLGLDTLVPVYSHTEWLQGQGRYEYFMGRRLKPFVRVKMGRRIEAAKPDER